MVQVKFTTEVPGDPRRSQMGRTRCCHDSLNLVLPWRDGNRLSVFGSHCDHTFIETLHWQRADFLGAKLGLDSPSSWHRRALQLLWGGGCARCTDWKFNSCVIYRHSELRVQRLGVPALTVCSSRSHLDPSPLGLGFPIERGWAEEGLQCPPRPGGQRLRGPDRVRHG